MRAALQNDEKALMLLANLYRFGAGTATNIAASYALSSYLATRGNSQAQALLLALESSVNTTLRAKIQKLLAAAKSPAELLNSISTL